MHPDAPLDRAALPDMPLDDGAGPALPMSEAAADALIEAALQQALPSRRRPRAIWWVAAAAVVLLGIPATAALYQYALAPRPSAPAPKPTPAPVDQTTADAPPPEAAVETTVEPTETAPPAIESASSRPARAKRRRTTRRGMRKRRRPAASPKTTPPPSAQSLLDEASRLRGERQWRRAAAAYARVAQVHPSGRAAYVSRISEASLHLEHLGDPKRALGLFEAALATGGPLDAEASWGRARALDRLGRDTEAHRALRQILQKYPSTPQARRAQRRLERTVEPSP